MGLQQRLDAFKAEFLHTAPVGRPALYEAKIEELRASFALERAIRTGDRAPDFTLPDPRGKGDAEHHLVRCQRDERPLSATTASSRGPSSMAPIVNKPVAFTQDGSDRTIGREHWGAGSWRYGHRWLDVSTAAGRTETSAGRGDPVGEARGLQCRGGLTSDGAVGLPRQGEHSPRHQAPRQYCQGGWRCGLSPCSTVSARIFARSGGGALCGKHCYVLKSGHGRSSVQTSQRTLALAKRWNVL
jgi:hypothetical protein